MNEPSFVQVIAMGLCTVFVVLICLIIIIKIMGAIMTKFTGNAAPAPAPAPAAAPPPVAQAPAAGGSKQQVVAAIAAAIAEDMGADVNHIKIHSIRKL